MADYTDIDPNTLLPGEPWTSAKALATFENPPAIAEGAAGAPVILGLWHPYDMVTAEDGATGEIWSFSADGASASIETPDFEDGFEYQLLCDTMSGSATADFRVGLYLATSGVYQDADLATSVNAAQTRTLLATAIRPRDVSISHGLSYQGWLWDGTTDTSGGYATFSIQNATAQKIGKARVTTSAGSFDGGQVRLFRRKLYG